MDPSLEAMFSGNDPAAAALVRVLNQYGAADDLLVMASVPGAGEATSADVDRLIAFARRFARQITAGPAAAKLVDAVMYKPDDDTRAFFQNVLVPSAVYYLDDASFTAALARLNKTGMEAQIRQDLTMMAMPDVGDAMGKALMADPLRLRDFLGQFLKRLDAQRPFRGRPGTDAFVSPDGKSLLIRVRGKKAPDDIDYCNALTRAVAAAADRANKADRAGPLELRYAGSYAIAAQSAGALRSDMIESVIGSVICLQLLFLLAYREPWRLFALAFAPIALGVLLGFGAYSVWRVGLSPLTAVLGGILAGMAIDYSVQYLSTYLSRRDHGAAPAEAARAAALLVTPAAFGAWATSIVGFVAIGASSVKALRDFSLLGSLGLAGAFLAAVALIPLLLMLTDRRAAGKATRPRFRFTLAPLLRMIGGHAGISVAICGAIFLSAVGVLLAARGSILPLESDLTVMHPRPNPALAAQALIGQRFGMRDWMLVYLQSDSPRNLVALAHRVDRRLQSAQAKAAGAAGSFGLASLLPDPAIVAKRQAILGPTLAQKVAEDFTSVIENTQIDGNSFAPDAKPIRDYEKFLHELLTRPPPTLHDLLAHPRDAVTGKPVYQYRQLAELMLPRAALQAGGALPTQAITLVFLNESTDQRAARDRAVEGLRAALAGEPGATLTGLSVVSHDSELAARRDLPRLSLLAMAVVLGYLVFHFRNIADALLAIAPTVFSLTILLAAMHLAGQKLNMVNLVAAPLLIGIDVDYGIFLVSLARLKQVRREDAHSLAARLAPVCHAVFICALATMIGFGSLIWTSVPAVRSLGFAVAVGIGGCLLCVLFLVVPVFYLLVQVTDGVPPGTSVKMN